MVCTIGASVAYGLSSGISTIVAQANGARDFVSVRKYFWYSWCLFGVLMFAEFFILFWGFALMKSIGINSELAENSKDFFRIEMIQDFSYQIFTMLNFFAVGLGHFWAGGII